jgi:hypothetical protein
MHRRVILDMPKRLATMLQDGLSIITGVYIMVSKGRVFALAPFRLVNELLPLLSYFGKTL